MALDDAVARQFRRRADAGEQQELRRVDRAGAEDHFAACLQLHDLASLADLHAGGAGTFQQHAQGQRRAEHGEVGPRQGRVQEGARRATAFAVDLGDVERADAFLALAVEVGVVRPAHFLGGLEEHLVDRPRAALRGDVQLAAAAVPGRFARLEMFRAAKVGEQLVVAPATVAEGCPAVVVVAVAADVDHPVDRAGAAPDLAARAGDRLVGGAGLGGEAMHPVPLRVGDQADDPGRRADVGGGERRAVAGAGLDQADRDGGIGGKTVGQDATGGAGADHDVVERAAGSGSHVGTFLGVLPGLARRSFSPRAHGRDATPLDGEARPAACPSLPAGLTEAARRRAKAPAASPCRPSVAGRRRNRRRSVRGRRGCSSCPG